MMTNRYPGNCRTCRATVNQGAGFVQKEGGSWLTYCREHAPEQIAPAATQTRKLLADGRVVIGYEPDNLPLLRSLPGYRNVKDSAGRWQMSCSTGQATLPRVLEIADKLSLEVAPELREACRQTEQAAAVAHDPRLYPFQVQGVDHVARRPRSLLADDMGLGKTVQALCSLPQDASAAVMVICSNSLKYNWVSEAGKWAPGYQAAVLSGKGGFRWPAPGELLAVNYDILPDVESVPAGITVIADEIQYAKNYKAKRSQRVAKICGGAAKVIALTGTPLMNQPFDLWGILNATGMAREVFGNFGTFLRLFGAEKDRWGGYSFQRPGPEVAERLRRVMVRRLRAEVLPDLPGKVHSEIVVNGVPAALARKLDRLAEEWDDILAAGELPPFEEFSAVRAELAASRVPAVLELAETYEESETPLVVFSAHRAPVDELGQREGWACITGDTPPQRRQEIVEAFQRGEHKGLALTIAAGGVGLTLTRAAHLVFVDLDWVPANNSQAEDRLVRIGQTASSVQITRLVSDHPLDRHVQKLLVEKIAMAAAAIEAVATIKVPEPPAVQAEGETEEQFGERLARIAAAKEAAERERQEQEAARQQAAVENRIKLMAERGLSKVGEWLAQPVTPEIREALRGAFALMCENDPDHAEELNGVGFNKPDSFAARWLGFGLGSDDEYRAQWSLLWKYSRQLRKQFPILWSVK